MLAFLKIKNSSSTNYKFYSLFLSFLFFYSCSPTKYLNDNQYILKENKIVLEEKSIDKSEIKVYSKQKPNRSILGYPLYIALYNMVDPSKEAKRDVKRAQELKEKNEKRQIKGKKLKTKPFYLSSWWRSSVGEAPVIFDAFAINDSKVDMNAYLRNLGYYESSISDTVHYNKDKKKVEVEYVIYEGKPYKINQFIKNITDTRVDSLISLPINNFSLDTAALFNAYKLDEMRYSISDYLQNNGYYGFGPDQVVFYADTNQSKHLVDMEMELFNSSIENDSTISEPYFPIYYFNEISIKNYPYQLSIMKEKEIQTTKYGADSVKFNYYDKLNFKPYLLHRRVDIRSDSIFRQKDIARSIRAINGLGIFKSVHFKINPAENFSADTIIKYIDCEIQLSPATKQSYTIDLEGYTSSGTVGTGLKFTYVHKNIFKRAIYFNLSLNGKVEKFTSDINASTGSMYAYEYGVNTTLRFPNFFSPFRLYKFNNTFFPNTLINVNYTFKDRSEYVRQTTSLAFGYSWSTPKGIKHNLNPIDFYLTEFQDIQYDYLQYLIDKNLYDQYFDHVIPAGNYSIFYSNQKINSLQNFFLVNMKFELAGNLFSIGNQLFDTQKTGSGDLYIKVIEAYAYEYVPDSLQQDYIEDTRDSLNTYAPSYYTFVGLLYNQYLKTDIDLRQNWFIGEHMSFIARFFGGIIFPYGNTQFSPIEKQYFVGGSNDLRAWWARSIGPGSYILDDQTRQLKNYYQNGDIKLLANFELRHNIMWRINGALFADIGNIWNIYQNPSFPDGEFKFDTFYQQMGLGIGYGLRFDFSFFIIRFDLAFKLRDPSINSNNKWVYSQGDSYYKKPILNFGIGYPF
ncbi:MAG: BamA/TamA family outer membrane protein [Bacteroidales bacterium]|nr:BamA/TamA family outer membrane protein [Bacteroidales bacterium]